MPPGKTIGLTTKLSVVIATWPPSTSTVPASAIASSVSLANAGTSRPSMRPCVALPPAPCAIVICVSRNFCFLARAVSMMLSTFCSRSETVGLSSSRT